MFQSRFQWIAVLVTLGITLVLVFHQVESCNEAVCGSVVSKCLLTQSCKCDLKNCTCCKECSACLSNLYSECCSCVDICPTPNDTEGSNLGSQSSVGELPGNVPELFKVLTDEPDSMNRWTTFTFPIQSDIFYFIQKKEIKLHMQSAEQEVTPIKFNATTVNCTVAFMSQCMSSAKCKNSCESMGASSFRWFHNGCCECVGNTCIDYGYKKSSCLECPLNDNGQSDDSALPDDNNFDYGEDGDIEEEFNENL